jgi:D-sedoheptulose 7-phosphate isomerase
VQRIKKIIKESILVKDYIYNNEHLINSIRDIINVVTESYKNKGKVLFCGNGGSAADAQHLAAELSGRFYYERPPLFAEALHVNTSYLTAVANDYSFDDVYSRLVKAFGKTGDILIGLSTSGNSVNIINAFIAAKKLGMKTIAFTGKDGGKLKLIADYLINVPSSDTPRIQESHIMIGHIICEIVESNMFPKQIDQILNPI